MDIPLTEDRCMNCFSPTSGKTLQNDVRKNGELESLKFELINIETILTVLLNALREDAKLRTRIG